MKMEAKKYIEYITHSFSNFTCTNLAEHLDSVCHDTVTDFLVKNQFTPNPLWRHVKEIIENRENAFLILDDSVLDKRHSKKIEMVKRQYSGNAHGLIRGIGIVNLVHVFQEECYPLNFRVYDPLSDGKTKNDHFRDLLEQAWNRGVFAQTILFDSWYASSENLKYIHRVGKKFVTILKSNRLVRLSKEEDYIHLQEIEWTEERIQFGVTVRLKKVPFLVQLFKTVATNGDVEWVITNHPPYSIKSHVVQSENKVRWFVEQFHREMKQLTGIERCQCRKQRAQRNHFFCCYCSWLSLKAESVISNETVYRIKNNLLSNYLRRVLQKPYIDAVVPV